MERINCWKKKILGSRRSYSGSSSIRLGHWLVVIATCCIVVGCTTLKKAGVTSLATGAAVTVATALSSGATVPILAATTTAFVASAVTDIAITGNSGRLVMNECAPDNFWSLIGSIIEMGGWLLILLILVPMILGWILPGPLERKRKGN